MRLERGALPEPEPLSCLREGPLVFTDDLLIDGGVAPPLPSPLLHPPVFWLVFFWVFLPF